ncbi:MAG: L-cystine transport system ATP-binding protein [Acidobacteriota bacterium]|nr:L-cystine transport system ATP-binding protein [Acidobacteriota bacterium]
MIKVDNLIKEFGGARILRGISFDVQERQVLGIIGASGSGKSTVLRCLNGLERIDGGVIDCDGVRLESGLSQSEYQKRVRVLRRKVGTVFQHLHLFPHLSALGNVAEAPVQVLREPRRGALKKAYELLEVVGLAHAAERYPDSLSGGEQQRVAIARALAMRPRVILFDEPTSALDPRRTNEMRALLRRFSEEGHTLAVVSHSINFITGLADQLLYMENGEVVEFGDAEQLLKDPHETRTRDFLQQAR